MIATCFRKLYDQDDGEVSHCQLLKGHKQKHTPWPELRISKPEPHFSFPRRRPAMTPIPPIPEDSPRWYFPITGMCLISSGATVIPDQAYVKLSDHLERIAKLTAEVERLKADHAYYVSLQEPQHRQALEERDEARAENTRLKAPVSDEE